MDTKEVQAVKLIKDMKNKYKYYNLIDNFLQDKIFSFYYNNEKVTPYTCFLLGQLSAFIIAILIDLVFFLWL